MADPALTRRSIIRLSLVRPTQFTVGMREVKYKRKQLRSLEKRPAELVEFILRHPVRVVIGPGGRAYVIDRHHFALALIKEKFETAPMEVEEDLSALSPRAFWKKMQARHFVHLRGADGKRRKLTSLPRRLTYLKDDPYRALAGFVCASGGFVKGKKPFGEFLWADYYRARITPKLLSRHFKKALREALELARHRDARQLPGYISVPAEKKSR